MIRTIDAFPQIKSIFENKTFNCGKWEEYINSICAGSADMFKNDIREYIDCGEYTFERDFLPILNAVYEHPALETLHDSFISATTNLNERIVNCFGREINIDIFLCVGLCNAAGWVTNIHGRDVIFLGIEKILELHWYDKDSMYGLICHELGHVYHKQNGFYNQRGNDNSQDFVWQLFKEGIATYFEQVLINDFTFYQQDKDGWLNWCESHFQQIYWDFRSDLPTMTRFKQRYFGDWVNYHGYGDVGYYLGTKYVQHLCERFDFNQLISFSIDEIYREFLSFNK